MQSARLPRRKAGSYYVKKYLSRRKKEIRRGCGIMIIENGGLSDADQGRTGTE